MASEWKPAVLGDVALKRNDFTPVDGNSEYDIVGVQRSGWGLVRREPVRGDSMKFSRLMRLEEGNLVYRTITAFEAPSAVVNLENAGAFVTPQTFPVFRLDETKILPAYMSLLTTFPKFHEAMASRCTGTVLRRKTLSVEAFLSIPIELPSLSEQQRIVDLIGALDDAVEAARATQLARLDLRDAMADSAFAQARDGQGTMATLAEVVGAGGLIQTGPFGSQLHSHDYVESGTPVVMPANIRRGRVDTEGIARVSQADVERLSKHKLRPGDIVWSRRGDVTRFARISEDDEQMICGTGCLLVRPDQAETTSWLAVWLSSKSMQNLIVDRAVGATMLNLNTSILSGLPVALPNNESASLGSALESIGATDLSGDRHLESLRLLRGELLSALLSGGHRIPETYDELVGA